MLKSKSNQIVLSVNEHTVKKNGNELELTPKEYEILKIFLEEKNKVIAWEKFVELAWEEPTEDVDFRLVDTHVKKLRDKLKTKFILTVRGYGYRWNKE